MSGSIRIFVPHPLHAGAVIAPSAAQAHYLGTVMRRGIGDAVRLFNGRDGEFECRITALRKDKAAVTVLAMSRPQAVEADLWLAFAPLKRDATDLVVQKATELGVAALLPVFTERTNAARINPDRLRAIAIEAAEQSERLSVPAIHDPTDLARLVATWPADRRLHVAVERSAAPWPRPAHGPAGLLVGPEGGLSRRDHDILMIGTRSVGVSLGPHVLRAETAAIVGLALLQAPGCG